MKKIVIALFIGLIVSAFPSALSAQDTGDNIYLTKTNTVENTDIPDLHNRGWDWAQNYFNTQDLKIVDKDLDEELIEVNVAVTLKGVIDVLYFTVKLDLKQNGYTYTITDVSNKTGDAIVTKYFEDLALRIERAMITPFSDDAKAKLTK